MTEHFLRLHHFLPASRANGPGNRAVIWVQGCSLGCPGCFNPDTHSFEDGQRMAVNDLFQRLLALEPGVEGVTISGGEPLQQLRPLTALLQRVRQETPLSVLLFTGFTWEEIGRMSEAERLLASVDVVLAGRYEAGQHLARGLRGSANKTVHFLTGRYGPRDLQTVPAGEVIITAGGEMIVTGIDPLK